MLMVERSRTINHIQHLVRAHLVLPSTAAHTEGVPGQPTPASQVCGIAIGRYPGLAYHGAVSKLGRTNEHVSLHS